MRRQPAVPWIIALTLAAAACEQPSAPVPAAPGKVRAPGLPSPADPQARIRVAPRRAQQTGFASTDEEYSHLARTIPGKFGGLYFDASGNPTVHLAEPGQRDAARAALATHLRGRFAQDPLRAKLDAAHIRFVQGTFDFASLVRWKEKINEGVFGIPGVLTTDADEVKNRVSVGVLDAAAAERVREMLPRLGVPANAVVTHIRERPREVSTLEDRTDKIAAGYQIKWFTTSSPTGRDACSLGFNAWRQDPYYGWEQVFVTAAHCSGIKWGPDGKEYFQNTTGLAADKIGYEVWDPEGYNDPVCSTRYRCRWSDALVALWLQPARQDFGRIARTTGLNNGSNVLDATRPRFNIMNKIMYGAVGDVVHKMGWNGGWGSASITNTCVDSLQGDVIHRCSEQAPFGAIQGDSGGPVFSMSGHEGWVFLRGVVWGPDAFSNMFNVEQDLGVLDVTLCISGNPNYPYC